MAWRGKTRPEKNMMGSCSIVAYMIPLLECMKKASKHIPRVTIDRYERTTDTNKARKSLMTTFTPRNATQESRMPKRNHK